MAKWDNLSTQQVQSEMDKRWDDGFVAGLEVDVNALPDWWFSTPPGRMGPYMRGYMVGREMQAAGLLPKGGSE